MVRGTCDGSFRFDMKEEDMKHHSPLAKSIIAATAAITDNDGENQEEIRARLRVLDAAIDTADKEEIEALGGGRKFPTVEEVFEGIMAVRKALITVGELVRKWRQL